MKTIKRVGILFLLCLTMLSVSFGATEVISSCPTTITNDTTYLLAGDFSANTNPCFTLNDNTGIVIDGNMTDLRDIAGNFVVRIQSDVDVDIQNIYHDTFEIDLTGIDNLIDFHDNVIENGYGIVYTGYTSGIPNTNSANILFNFRPSGTSAGVTSNFITITDNRFIAPQITPPQDDNYVLFFFQDSTFYGTHLTIQGNDMLGWGVGSQRLQNNGAVGIGTMSLMSLLFDDNNYARHKSPLSYLALDLTTSTCSNFAISSNNLLSYLAQTDADQNSVSDDIVTITQSGCTLLNNNIPTRKLLESAQWFPSDFNEEYVIDTMMIQSVHSNTRYILSKALTLNSTDYFDFDSAMNSQLDLSMFPNINVLTLTNVRTLQMGNDNEIYGGTGTQPIISTSGTISISDVGLYANNWQLIDYSNGLRIDNINFDLNAVDNYGLIRKYSQSVDGLNFEFENNIVDLNFVPNDPDRPLIVFGAFATIKNNEFDLLGTVNISLFGGGISSTVGGGHVIQDNSFFGGGFIFSRLTDAFGGINYQSKLNHNEFRQVGVLYAMPFHPTDDSQNLLDDPLLNGTYYYNTLCTNYVYNLGNYYEDWADSGFYNDTNGDGIHDGYNGVECIYRGDDFEGDPINDCRSVVPYPYDLSGNTGTVIGIDICDSFNYNILSPTAQNYTSGYELTSDWEFISIAYPDMYCFETLNGFTSLYEGVVSGDNMGQVYETTDGHGTFDIKCCDTVQCDNVVQESEPIEFCIGNCELGELIVSGTTTPPTIIQGCTDPTATNYNPLANQDDGSCTYPTGDGGDEDQIEGIGSIGNLFSTDYEASGDSIGGLFALASEPIGWLILVGFVFLGLTLLGLIFALVMWMIGG